MEKQSTKGVVLSFIDALNTENFEEARKYIADDLSFVGAMGTRQGGDTYINDMKGLLLKYNISKTFVEEDDVCLIYNIRFRNLNEPIYSCGLYRLENGKIKSIRVVFDPRPLLQR